LHVAARTHRKLDIGLEGCLKRLHEFCSNFGIRLDAGIADLLLDSGILKQSLPKGNVEAKLLESGECST